MLNIDLVFFQSLHHLTLREKMLKAALWYAKQGYKVLPMFKGTKRLGLSMEYATCDPEIIKRWFTKDFPEGNITIVLEETGVSVLDGDRHGDVDGFINAGLKERDFDGLVAMTPHNGLHLYLREAPNPKRLPEGMEHKTQRVIVPPSIVDDVPYEWRSGGEPQPLSTKLQAMFLGMKLVKSDGESSTKKTKDEVFAEASIGGYTSTPVAPAGYCKRLLDHIDPDCDYDMWSRVGMALHHNDESDLMLDIWREWSAESPKYKEGECDRKWSTFNNNRADPITLRWLIRQAKLNGCPDSPEDAVYYGSSLAFDREVDELNKKYVYREMGSGIRICHLKKHSDGTMELCQWKEADFRSSLQNRFVHMGAKSYPAAEVWLKNPNRRVGEVNMWEVGKEPPGALNLFQGLTTQPVPCKPKDIQQFLDFTLDVICRGNKEYQHYLLDLLAFKVQHPLDISGICLVLQGGEGTGKGSLCRIMETLIGRTHTKTVSERSSLLGEFTGGLASALWITANEAVWAGHHGEAERLKAMITEPNLEWNQKNVPIWEQRNCIQLAMTTNDDWAVPAGLDSRRFFVLRVADEKAKNEAYWKAFNALMGRDRYWKPNNPEYMGKILYYLQQRKITSDFTNALETVWLKEQRSITAVGSLEEAFHSWVSLFLDAPTFDSYEGRTSKYEFSIVQYQDKDHIVFSHCYDDFKRFVKENYSIRKPYPKEKFNTLLMKLGFNICRPQNSTLRAGPSKFSDKPRNRTTIAEVPEPNALRKALDANYKLFSDDVPEVDED